MSIGAPRNHSVTRPQTQPATNNNPATTNPAAATANNPNPVAPQDAYRPVAAQTNNQPVMGPLTRSQMQDRTSFSMDLTKGRFSATTPLSSNTTASGSVQVTPNGVNVSGGVQANLPGGVKVGFQSSVSLSGSNSTESKDGFTTTTATGTVSMTNGASASVGNVGGSVSATNGSTASFQVRMSDADYARVAAGQASPPNPFDPASMPVGSSVKLEQQNFQGTQFEASYRQIKLQNSIREEQGASILVEKTGQNTVRVTTGPNEAIQNSFRVGVQLGPANISIGNTTRIDSATLKTAEFDLSTDAGRTAYNDFLANGTMPTANGGGVSNAATIQKFSGVSSTDLTAKLGPLSIGLTNTNSADQTMTTFADGSKKVETNLDYDSAVPIKIQQHFRPDGTEDLSQQKFTLPLGQFGNEDRGTASSLVYAFTGDAAKAEAAFNAVRDGQGGNFEISFTRDQALELQQRTRDYMHQLDPNWYPVSVQDHTLQNFMDAQNPLVALTEIGRGMGNKDWLATTLMGVSLGFPPNTDTARPLAGTLQTS